MKKYEMLGDESFVDFAKSLQQREDQDNEERVKIEDEKVKLRMEIESLERKLGYRVWDLIGHEDAIIDKYNRLMKFMKTDEYKKYKE